MAAIGIGSNSLRMLIASMEGNKLCRLKRFREGLRTFAALDEQGCLTKDMIAQTCRSVAVFQQKAMDHGVREISLFATSAVRDAQNQDALIQALEQATGLSLDVCEGQREALLSYLGCAETTDPMGLIDIGGGSTEIALGCYPQLYHSISMQLGAVRLALQKEIQSVEQAQDVALIAEQIIQQQTHSFQKCLSPMVWVGTGGTFTCTASFLMNSSWEERHCVHGYQLTHQAVEQAMAQLSPLTVAQRLALPAMQPQRADIVVHGIAILLGCMRALHIPKIQVSECGNLEGYLKEKYQLR